MAYFKSTSEANLQKIILPSTKTFPEADRGWVVMDVSPVKTADTLYIPATVAPMEAQVIILSGRIKEWNLQEESGETAQISFENIARMEPEDVRFLGTFIKRGESLTTEEKKTSPSTSATAPTVVSTTSQPTPSQ